MNKITQVALSAIRIVLICFLILAVIGMWRLNLNTEIFKLLPNTPALQNLKKYNAIFSSLDKFSFSIVTDKPDLEKLFSVANYTTNKLKEHKIFSDISYKFDLLTAVEMKDFYQANLPNLLDKEDMRQLEQRISLKEIENRMESIFEQLVEIGPSIQDAKSDPLQLSHIFWRKLQLSDTLKGKIVNGALVSQDNRAILLRTSANTAALDSLEIEKIWQFLYHLKQDIAINYPGTTLVCVGGKRVMLDNVDAIWQDAQLTSLLASISLAILMFLVLRNFILFPLIFIPVGFGIFTSMGISSLFAPQFSLLTLGFGAILIGISVDYVIHYICHLESSNNQKIIYRIFKPMSFAAFSTCGALAFLFYSDFPVHVETAWFVGTGIFSSFLFVVGFFPQICQFATRESKREPFVNLSRIWKRSHQNKFRIVVSCSIIIFSLLLTILAASHIKNLKFVGEMEKFNYMSETTKKDESIFFSFWGNQQGKIAIISYGESIEEALRSNDLLHDYLNQFDSKEIQILTIIHHLLPSLHKMQQNHEIWKQYWTEQKRQQLKKDMLRTSQEYGFSSTAFSPFFQLLDEPQSPESMKTLLENDTFLKLTEGQLYFFENKWYIQNIIQVRDNSIVPLIEQNVNGIFVVNRKKIVDEISDSLFEWTITATVVISLYVLILFFLYFVHSELVFIGLLPLFLSLLWILGVMGYCDIPLNFFSALMIIFVLGLGIDYSTFIVTSYIESLGNNNDFLDTTRSAIFLSAATTLISFGVLIFAIHPALYSLGVCVLLAMSSVLFTTTFLTPIVLRYFIPEKRQAHPIRFIHALNSLWCFILYAGGIVLLALVVFPVLTILKPVLKLETRKTSLYLIGLINRRIMGLALKSKIYFLNFPKKLQSHIVICNHTNTADIPLFNGLPFLKVTMVKWFWKFPIVNYLLKTAGFLRVPSQGEDYKWEQHCKDLLKRDLNILFFPEGTRAKQFKMGRFRMGAFHIALTTKTPILPVCFYGNRWVMAKGRFVARDCNLYASALPVITPENYDYDNSSSRELAKYVKKKMQQEYENLSLQEQGSNVQLNLIKDCYRYLNPFFDIYLYWKIQLDKNYTSLVKLLPRQGNILDVGCGIGFLSNLLVYSKENVHVWGIDYDENKIQLAQRSIISYVSNQLKFIHGDIFTSLENNFPLSFFNGILCCDLLHYFPFEKQREILYLLGKLIAPEGVLVIRQDTHLDKGSRKKFELWAKILKFNHFNSDKLYYPDEKILLSWINEIGFVKQENNLVSKEEGQCIFVLTKIGNV